MPFATVPITNPSPPIDRCHAERTHQGNGNVILFPADANSARTGPVLCRGHLWVDCSSSTAARQRDASTQLPAEPFAANAPRSGLPFSCQRTCRLQTPNSIILIRSLFVTRFRRLNFFDITPYAQLYSTPLPHSGHLPAVARRS